MRIRLTERNAATLQARGGRLAEFWDVLVPGLTLRVSPTGVRTFSVAIWSHRKKRRIGLGRYPELTVERAREMAKATMRALEHGEDPRPRDTSVTVSGLVEQCLADIRIRPTTRTEYDRLRKRELGLLGPRRAADVCRADVRAWLRPLRQRSPYLAHNALALVARSFAWAQREDILEHNPCAGVTVPSAPSRDRVLSAVELAALLRALCRGARRFPSYASATTLLLLTGVRQAAVLGIRRDELHDLDGEAPRWVVPTERSKGGRAHVVPLSGWAVRVIRERLGGETQCLYPARRLVQGTEKRQDRPMLWSSKWRTWLRRRVERSLAALARLQGREAAPVPAWRIHDLRRAMATHLREDLGVPHDVVSMLLSHSFGVQVSRIYDRSSRLGERRKALEAWERWLTGLLPVHGHGGAHAALGR